ncbi:MAG: hypothetical protein K0R49_1089 [Burkholderiales bacterium]|jgi:hypothetical protein|nr:hypothetical protein [Burkholderiales bacterium]
MIKLSKFIFISFFIISGILNSANAVGNTNNLISEVHTSRPDVDIYLLDLNVKAWNTLTPDISKIYNGGGPKFVNYIMKDSNKFDFITTQEDDKKNNSYPLISSKFGNMASLYDMYGPNGDATIYYRKDRWTPVGRLEIPITSDDMDRTDQWFNGKRIAVLSKFQSIASPNRFITIANTHYCVGWSQDGGPNSRGCLSIPAGKSQSQLHIEDTSKIAAEINLFTGGSTTPTIFTGDLNNYEDPQATGIKNVLLGSPYNMKLVEYINNRPPLAGIQIDHILFRGLTQQGLGTVYFMGNPQDNLPNYDMRNLSDHDGGVVAFNFGDTPPPVTCDVAPTTAHVYHSGTNTVTIDLDSNNASNFAGLELWPWNKTQGPITASTSQPHLTFNSPQLGNPGPDNSYEFWARTKCTGSASYSAWEQIKFYK